MIPFPAYPHLTPQFPSNPTVHVQIGLSDTNLANPVLASRPPFAYVLYKMDQSRTRPTRIMLSSEPESEWKLGTALHLVNSSRGDELGDYMIVGVKDTDSGEYAGQIPDRLIKTCMKV